MAGYTSGHPMKLFHTYAFVCVHCIIINVVRGVRKGCWQLYTTRKFLRSEGASQGQDNTLGRMSSKILQKNPLHGQFVRNTDEKRSREIGMA